MEMLGKIAEAEELATLYLQLVHNAALDWQARNDLRIDRRQDQAAADFLTACIDAGHCVAPLAAREAAVLQQSPGLLTATKLVASCLTDQRVWLTFGRVVRLGRWLKGVGRVGAGCPSQAVQAIQESKHRFPWEIQILTVSMAYSIIA